MAINKAEQTLEDKLIVTVSEHDRALQEIKSRQPVGGDILQVQKIPAGTAYLQGGPLTIPASQHGTFIVNFTPDQQTLTLWNTLWTLYIDTIDAAHQYPSGSSLDENMRNIMIASWWDWADSNDTTNFRVFKINIFNNGSISHDYYIRIKGYIPQLSNTTTG